MATTRTEARQSIRAAALSIESARSACYCHGDNGNTGQVQDLLDNAYVHLAKALAELAGDPEGK